MSRRIGYAVLFRRPARRGGVLTAVLGLILLGLFLSTAIGLQHLRLRKIKPERPYIDSLMLPRAEYAKLLAFGYDSFMADFLYMRAIQAFGGQWNLVVKDYASLYDFFYSMSALDPHFIEIYDFGSLVIGEEGRSPEKAIDLNRFGWIKNPDKYRPPYNNAFISYWTLEEATRAKFWVRMALRAQDHPDYLSRWINFLEQASGRYEAALENWVRDYLKGAGVLKNWGRDTPEQDAAGPAPYLVAIADGRIRDVLDEWNRTILHDALDKYREEHNGALPETLEDVVRGGYLSSYRGCNSPRLFGLLEVAANSDGVTPGQFRKIIDASVGDLSGVPPSPFGPPGEDHRYFVRKDLGDEEGLEDAIKGHHYIISVREAREYVSSVLAFMRSKTKAFQEERGRPPIYLNEAFEEDFRPRDVMGRPWSYDPAKGEVTSPSFPDL